MSNYVSEGAHISHNHQLLCLVLLVEKEIFVSWKGDLHNGDCFSVASLWRGQTFVFGGVF